MATVKVDFSKPIGKIKDLNGIGQPPIVGLDNTYFHYLTEANIPCSRLHDTGGFFGANMYVDIPNIFRDFDADENDPASYDFAFTDILLRNLIEAGCEPYYRLGVTIENFHKIKAYRIFPPKDYAKWARICEHIIRHYNEGWADGFHYGITYWEIWNEPDGAPNGDEWDQLVDINENTMWKGTKEQFFDLYRVTSKHLRACFGDSIKIGGYGSCGFYLANNKQTVTGRAFGGGEEVTDWDKRLLWFYLYAVDFFRMVKDEGLPLDFFSHHSYAPPKETANMQRMAEKTLKEAGLEGVEIHLNEWNTDNRLEDRGTTRASGNTLAMLCEMQHTAVNVMCYYDARMNTGVFAGLFDPNTRLPVSTYYSLYAFGKLRALGTEVSAVSDDDNVLTLAATDGSKKGAVLVNIGEKTEVTTDLHGMTVYRIDREHLFTKTDEDSAKLVLGQFEAVYIE